MYSTSYSTLYVEVTRALGTHYNTRWPRPPNIGIEEKGFRECFEKLIAQSLPRHQIRLYLKRLGTRRLLSNLGRTGLLGPRDLPPH